MSKQQFTMADVPILYEDNSIIVVVKPQNIPTQADKTGDLDLLNLLKSYIKEKYNKQGEVYLGLVHRLDRPTGGVMVFARNSKSASRLSQQIRDREVDKTYLATVLNCPKERSGELVNYLKKNPLTNTVFVATLGDKEAKRAELTYKVLDSYHDVVSLVEVQLGTGRGHQIRVQFSAIGCPLFGDARYGGDALAKGYNLALWAYKLQFVHPVSKEHMVFVSYPPNKEPWTRFDIDKFIKASYINAEDAEGEPLFASNKVIVRTNLD